MVRNLTFDVIDHGCILRDAAAEKLILVDDFINRNSLWVEIWGSYMVVEHLLTGFGDGDEAVQSILCHFLFIVSAQRLEDGGKSSTHV